MEVALAAAEIAQVLVTSIARPPCLQSVAEVVRDLAVIDQVLAA